MQIQPHQVNAAWHLRHVVISSLGGLIAGGSLMRWANAIVKSMPPLPSNAGWWQTWAYNSLKAVTALDPANTK